MLKTEFRLLFVALRKFSRSWLVTWTMWHTRKQGGWYHNSSHIITPLLSQVRIFIAETTEGLGTSLVCRYHRFYPGYTDWGANYCTCLSVKPSLGDAATSVIELFQTNSQCISAGLWSLFWLLHCQKPNPGLVNKLCAFSSTKLPVR